MIRTFVFGMWASAVLCEREHKVHNIVLYPERHSWCQTTAIKQIVAMPGYEPVTIDNNVCVGACYSYSIPRTQPAEPGELIGPYCDSCQPLATKCYHVTLQSGDQYGVQKTVQKRVQIITNCSCNSCTNVQASDCEVANQNTSELPMNLFSLLQNSQNKTERGAEIPEISELLNMPPPKNNNRSQIVNNRTAQRTYNVDSKMIALLKRIQDDDDEDYDKAQLKQLLDLIGELSNQNLMDFVNYVNVHNSEDLELDLVKLKEVLLAFEEQSLLDRHRDYGLGDLGKKDNDAINADLDANKYKFATEGNRLNLGLLKGSHIGMGIHERPDLETNIVDVKGKPDDGKRTSTEDIANKGHHHLGEVQNVGSHVGRLIRGPHDSLVLETADSVKVEEKLNLDSDEMRPNHEGTVVSYENHPHHHHHHRHH